jgi:hypothetical protein
MGWSQIMTTTFVASIEKSGSSFLVICYPVNSAGTPGAQSGVQYHWKYKINNDSFINSGPRGEFYLPDTALKTIKICMHALVIVNGNDTLYETKTCKETPIYGYSWIVRGLEIPHIFYEDKNQNCQLDNGEEILNVLAEYVGKHGSFFNHIR